MSREPNGTITYLDLDSSSDSSCHSVECVSDPSASQARYSENIDENAQCAFCKSREHNPRIYGEKMKYFNEKAKAEEYVHFSCLLFASGLVQRGDMDSGLSGFLVVDILKEKQRGNQLKCSYCKISGATIGCNRHDCSIQYHLACAMAQPTSIRPSFSYIDPYKSYCGDHRPLRKLHSVNLLNERDSSRCICPICQERVKILPSLLYEVIQCSHCAQLIHIGCISGWALSAGRAHFKCPGCHCRGNTLAEVEPLFEDDPEIPRKPVAPIGGRSDVNHPITGEPLLYSYTLLVREEMMDRSALTRLQCQRLLVGTCLANGVNVPVSDAAWESNQPRRLSIFSCTAKTCLCPHDDGRSYEVIFDEDDDSDDESSTQFSPWNMLLCRNCEGLGRHRKCHMKEEGNVEFRCEVCKPPEEEDTANRRDEPTQSSEGSE